MAELLYSLVPSFLDEFNELFAWTWKAVITYFLARYGYRRHGERKVESKHRSDKSDIYRKLTKMIEHDEENGDATLSGKPNPHMDSASASVFFYQELKQHRKSTDANFSDLRKDLHQETVEIRKSVAKVSERVARLEGPRKV